MDVGEIARGTVSYEVPGASLNQNVFYWDLSLLGQTDSAVFIEIANWITFSWANNWADSADSNVVLNNLAVDIVNTDGTVDRNLGSQTFNIPGDDMGHVLPAANSGFLQANTGIPKSRGRKFIPGGQDTDVTEGLWNTLYLAYLVALLGPYLTIIDVGGLSNLNPGVLATVLQTFLQFSGSAETTNVPAYQRRRKPGVGI